MNPPCSFVAAGALCLRGATAKSILAGRALCCIHELAVAQTSARQKTSFAPGLYAVPQRLAR